MKKEELWLLIEKYADGKCNREEEIFVETYFENCQENNIQLPEEAAIIKSRMYGQIKKTIQKRARNLKLQKQRKVFLKIVAALLFIIGCGTVYKLLNKQEFYTETTALGEKKTISLPDGSVVSLNSATVLSYSSGFNEKNREVTLSGEAYFEVTHNKEKPFIVHTKHLNTKVLGTSFNINAYNGNHNAKVSVTTGKVNVYNTGAVNELLIKNEQLSYNIPNQKYKKEHRNSANDIAWKDNVILLDDIDLETASKILEKWFNVSIAIEGEGLKSKRIFGKYKNPILDDVLESLEFSIGIKALSTNNQIIIKKKNPS
ncbi:FecR family protein [Galbibacter sp. PAP.153]|uniref:FecR family protein n=1 Tax=Galbibacter sp. PAP.153 TaxID=3104623 RepID=UPI003009723D